MAGGEVGESLEAAWERLEAQIDLAEGFWLGFVFCASPQAVLELRERAERRFCEEGKELHRLTTEQPQLLSSMLRRLLEDEELTRTSTGCTWVEAIRSDSAGAAEQPWSRAWESLFLRVNEHRDALRVRLRGGLVFAAPPEIKSLVRESAPDLWSVRSLVIDLSAQGMPLPRLYSISIPPPAEQTQVSYRTGRSDFDDHRGSEPWTPKNEAARLAEQLARAGNPASASGASGIARSLLDAAEARIVAGRIDEGRELAALAHEHSKGRDALVDAEALYLLAWAEAQRGDIARASEHIQEAIDLRRSAADGDFQMDWVALAAELARRRREASRGATLYEAAASFYRERARETGSIESLMRLQTALSGLGEIRQGESNLSGAATAFDEAVVVARRLCDVRGDLPEAFGRLSAALIKLADVRESRGDVAGALGNFEEAVSAARRLHVLAGDSGEGLRQISVALTRVGAIRGEIGDFEGARAAFQEALELRRRRLASVPQSQAILRDLASCLRHIGKLEVAAGNLAGGDVALYEALAINRERVKAFPGASDVLWDLCVSLFMWGDVLRKSGAGERAAAVLSECKELAGRLDRGNPRTQELVEVALRALAELKRPSDDDGSQGSPPPSTDT